MKYTRYVKNTHTHKTLSKLPLPTIYSNYQSQHGRYHLPSYRSLFLRAKSASRARAFIQPLRPCPDPSAADAQFDRVFYHSLPILLCEREINHGMERKPWIVLPFAAQDKTAVMKKTIKWSIDSRWVYRGPDGLDESLALEARSLDKQTAP